MIQHAIFSNNSTESVVPWIISDFKNIAFAEQFQLFVASIH